MLVIFSPQVVRWLLVLRFPETVIQHPLPRILLI